MKHAVLVSPYFLPSNVAGVQRVRLMSRALKEFGWDPTVVTVNHQYYEEALDWDSLRLLPEDLKIERVSAWPAKICRRLGIGDVSLRGQCALRQCVKRLVKTVRPSVVFATVLPGYTSLVGSWARRCFGVPFILDYQDPWVPQHCSFSGQWNKAGLAHRLACWLEPKVLRHVDALTAVSDETLDTLRSRRLIRDGVPIKVLPIGADRRDHLIARQYGRSFIQRKNGTFHIAYLGTLTERMLPALQALLQALDIAAASSNTPDISVHLIGTSAQPGGRDQHNLAKLTNAGGLNPRVQLHPKRIGYLDALRTMQDSDLLVLLGSTDSHYTASKLFPYWLSGKPILGLFHEASNVVALSRSVGGVTLVLYSDDAPPQTRVTETAELLKAVLHGAHQFQNRNENAFQPYSAEGISQQYAALFDQVCAP